MFTANVLFLKKTKSSFHNHTFLSLITLTKVLAYLWRKEGSFSIIWLFFTWIVIISPFPLIKSLMEKQSRQSQKGITLKVQHKLCHNFNHFHHFNYLSQFSHLSKYAGSDIIFCSVIPMSKHLLGLGVQRAAITFYTSLHAEFYRSSVLETQSPLLGQLHVSVN